MGEAHRRALGARAKRVADTWVPILTPIKHKKHVGAKLPHNYVPIQVFLKIVSLWDGPVVK